jgi:UPF0176 protein
MFCTGGIRCEKASSLMKAKGFKNIYHLQGGILNYMEKLMKKIHCGRVSVLFLMIV